MLPVSSIDLVTQNATLANGVEWVQGVGMKAHG